MGTFASVLGAIAWDPEIRNILSVAVGVLVLCGSVYLIVATNTGIRSGFLITITGLLGWMATMGIIWWIYGIGMQGGASHWEPEELNYSGVDYADLADAVLTDAHSLTVLADLPSAQDLLDEDPDLAQEILPPELFEEGADEDELEARIATITIGQIIEVRPELAEEYEEALGGWELLPVSDRQRGDASATADAFLGPDGRALFDSSSEYLLRDVFSLGGKPERADDSMWGRFTHKISTIVKFTHPPHYAVVQVQPVVAQDTIPGQAPPAPVIDEDAPVISVVLVRNLGDKRLPAAMTTLICGALFILCCWVLHRRDSLIAKARAATV